MAGAVVLGDVRFAWPDGGVVLDGVSAALSGRTALVGVNGAGKSTVARLVVGELSPTAGTVHVTGRTAYLPQDLVLHPHATVADALGITGVREALQAVEAGDLSRVDDVGNAWDIEERAHAVLDRLGLGGVVAGDLDRPLGTLSGGQATLLALSARLLERPNVLVLDEPTTHLDGTARERLLEAVAAYDGLLLVVTHDRELLGVVDRIGDVREGGIRWYAGNLADYEEAVAAEQDAAAQRVRDAEQDVRRQKRELSDARTALDRRARFGRRKTETKREPKVIMQARKREAEVSAGKYRRLHEGRLRTARERLRDDEQALRDDDRIRVDLPDTAVPPGRRVLRLTGVRTRTHDHLDLEVVGPERLVLLGRNGSGKTTLLDTVAGRLTPLVGEVSVDVPFAYLPQTLTLLNDDRSVLEHVLAAAPGTTEHDARARLARFLFKGRESERPTAALSGGERLRATLAALLLARPAPQLLLLDEPTNHLDATGVAALADALSGFRGALVVAGHDSGFAERLGPTARLLLDDGQARRR